MATIHLQEATSATPEQVVAALTDFGPGRSKVFPNTADEKLIVHERGPGHADVTEGTSTAWERLRYDWSDPTHIIMKTTDSNVWGGDSGHTWTLTRRPDGGTDIDAVVVRDGKNLKGRLLGVVVSTVGKRVLAKGLATTVRAIESRGAASEDAG